MLLYLVSYVCQLIGGYTKGGALIFMLLKDNSDNSSKVYSKAIYGGVVKHNKVRQ